MRDVATRLTEPVRTAQVGDLRVEVYRTRAELGAAAAATCRRRIHDVLARRRVCRMIFGAAPSQNELLAALRESPDIAWERIEAFHMDEYRGLAAEAPQRLASFLRNALFEQVPLRAAHLLDSAGLPADQEGRRYADLLEAGPIDVVCLGVGENGHLAFNDPSVADFDDPKLLKEVLLDRACRLQQVNDGCFASFAEVPERAITLTIPSLLRGESLICCVPGERKAEAVKAMLKGPIAESCPASVLRRHPDCTLYLDIDSAADWMLALD